MVNSKSEGKRRSGHRRPRFRSRSTRSVAPALLLGAVFFLGPGGTGTGVGAGGLEGGRAIPGGGRLAPPEAIHCPRNQLTAFAGTVLAYRRDSGKIILRLRTDEETTENFRLQLGKSEEPIRWFLLEGRSFQPNDWSRIESGPGRLHDGMRVIVWVCEGDERPVLDWRPPEGAGKKAAEKKGNASDLPR